MPKSAAAYERSPSSSRTSTYSPTGVAKERLEQVHEVTDYPWLFEQPFPDPLETLCHSYGLGKADIRLAADEDIPHTIDMPLLGDEDDEYYFDEPHPTPTHALVIASNDPHTPSTPIIAPINLIAFSSTFTYDITRQQPCTKDPPAQPNPAPRDHAPDVPPAIPPIRVEGEDVEEPTMTLPTILLPVPHPPSLPLVLLFALAPHLPAMYRPPPPEPSPSTQTHHPTPSRSRAHSPLPRAVSRTPCPSPPPSPPPRTPSPPPQFAIPMGLFPTYLLPTFVIEELPAFPAAAAEMARRCSMAELNAYTEYNMGVWRNLLALSPKNEQMMDFVQFALKTTTAARREK